MQKSCHFVLYKAGTPPERWASEMDIYEKFITYGDLPVNCTDDATMGGYRATRNFRFAVPVTQGDVYEYPIEVETEPLEYEYVCFV